VQHYRAMHKGSPKGRRTRKQVGGMAPLSWDTAQGSFDKVYGEFPAPISGLSWAAFDQGRFAESPTGRACDTTGGHSVQMGGGAKGGGSKKQKGGSLYAAIGMGHPPMSVYPNIVQTGTYALQGSTSSMEPSASPITQQATPAVYTPAPFNPKDISNMNTDAVYAPIQSM